MLQITKSCRKYKITSQRPGKNDLRHAKTTQTNQAHDTIESCKKNIHEENEKFRLKTTKNFNPEDISQMVNLIGDLVNIHKNKIPYPTWKILEHTQSILAGLGREEVSALRDLLSEDDLERIRAAATNFVDSLSPKYTKEKLKEAIPTLRNQILQGNSRDLLLLINTVNSYCGCEPERSDLHSRYALSINRRWPQGIACNIVPPSNDPEFLSSRASTAVNQGDGNMMKRILSRLSKLPEARQREFWIQRDSTEDSILTQAFVIDKVELNEIIGEAFLKSSFTLLEKAQIFGEGTRWSVIQTDATARIKGKLATQAKSLISANGVGVDANFFSVLMAA
jgi:hypothetical protein